MSIYNAICMPILFSLFWLFFTYFFAFLTLFLSGCCCARTTVVSAVQPHRKYLFFLPNADTKQKAQDDIHPVPSAKMIFLQFKILLSLSLIHRLPVYHFLLEPPPHLSGQFEVPLCDCQNYAIRIPEVLLTVHTD